MLKIYIPEQEVFDSSTESFTTSPGGVLELEHSLVAISEWESVYHKSFIDDEKDENEILFYIKCMVLNKENLHLIKFLTDSNVQDITKYIQDPRTATTFSNKKNPGVKKRITSELIYYWMIASNIPFECQNWHINRLMTLIEVCSINNEPPKKMSQKDILSRNRELNAARRKAMHSTG